MKTIRKIAPIFGLFMSFMIVFISCKQTDILEAQVNAALSEVSGQDVFKSILFADGAMTNQIPQLEGIATKVSNFSEEQKAEYTQFQEEVITHLQSLDPNYFESFKAQILTKDVTIIDKELAKIGEDLLLFTEQKADEEGIEMDKIVSQYSHDLDLESYETRGLAIWLIVTIVVALVIAVAATITKVSVDDVTSIEGDFAKTLYGDDASLSHQQFILEISNLK